MNSSLESHAEAPRHVTLRAKVSIEFGDLKILNLLLCCCVAM